MKREQNIFDISGNNLKYDKRYGQKVCEFYSCRDLSFSIRNLTMTKFLSTPFIQNIPQKRKKIEIIFPPPLAKLL